MSDIGLLQDDVEAFMSKPENNSAEVVIKRFDELYKKYKFMEYNLSQKKKRYCVSLIADVKLQPSTDSRSRSLR